MSVFVVVVGIAGLDISACLHNNVLLLFLNLPRVCNAGLETQNVPRRVVN